MTTMKHCLDKGDASARVLAASVAYRRELLYVESSKGLPLRFHLGRYITLSDQQCGSGLQVTGYSSLRPQISVICSEGSYLAL
jgi:hypothetical protein